MEIQLVKMFPARAAETAKQMKSSVSFSLLRNCPIVPPKNAKNPEQSSKDRCFGIQPRKPADRAAGNKQLALAALEKNAKYPEQAPFLLALTN